MNKGFCAHTKRVSLQAKSTETKTWNEAQVYVIIKQLREKAVTGFSSQRLIIILECS